MNEDAHDNDDLTVALNLALLHDDQELGPGSLIGNFVIERQLGEGGMGTVWLAEQVEPVRRQVAIKLSRKRRMSGPELELFMLERQAMARINHPSVGQIYEAGALENGTPFFVMEYVQGSTVAGYCAQRRLSVDERIELMIKVCLGIEHAHQKGVLHCDLKPSNIVVTEVDGGAQPKIIDFGLARMLDRRPSKNTMSGTVPYLAPEQIDPTANLDTRTDVYTLGLILYELLAGRRLRDNLPTDDDPSLKTLQSILGKKPQIDLVSSLAGKLLPSTRRCELEAIIERALDPDPEARYSGAAALASDLTSWLALEPVDALPPTNRYRWQCLVRRHRLAFAISGVALLALIGGLVGTALGLRTAQVQRSIAEARQADLERVVQFQQNLLAEVDMNDLAEKITHRLSETAGQLVRRDGGDEASAEQARSESRAMIERLAPVDAARDLMVQGILEQADTLIEEQYADNSAIEAALRLSLGQTLLAWQDFDAADTQIEAARAYYASIDDVNSRNALEAETEAIKLRWWLQRFPEAYALAKTTRPRAEAALGIDDALSLYLLRAETALSSNVEGAAVAVESGRRLVDRLTELRGSGHPDTLQAEGDLLYDRIQGGGQQRCDEGLIEDFLDHLVRAEALSDRDRRTVAISSMNLGTCLGINGQFDEAVHWLGRAAEVGRAVLGERHTITMMALTDRANYLLVLDRLDEAEDVVDSLYGNQRSIYGENSPYLAYPRSYRLYLNGAKGQANEAIAGMKALLEESRLQNELPMAFRVWLHRLMSWTQENTGRLEQARLSAEAGLDLCQSASGPPELCLLPELEVTRLAALGGATADPTRLNTLLDSAKALHPNHFARSLAAWLVYRFGEPEEPRADLMDQELAWLLEVESRNISIIQQRIVEDLRSNG